MQYSVMKDKMGQWVLKNASRSCFYLPVLFFIVKGVLVTSSRWFTCGLSMIGMFVVLLKIDAAKHEYTPELVFHIWNGAISPAFFMIVAGFVLVLDLCLFLIVGSHPLIATVKNIYEFLKRIHGKKRERVKCITKTYRTR